MALFFTLLSVLLDLFYLIILVRVFLSWVPNIDRSNPTVDMLMQLIFDITEPVLRPIRQALPPTTGIDFSPMVVLIGLFVIRSVLRI